MNQENNIQLTQAELYRINTSPKYQELIAEVKAETDRIKSEIRTLESDILSYEKLQQELIYGEPQYSDKTFLEVIDGNVYEVRTDRLANIQSVKPINSYDELGYSSLRTLYNSDTNTYNALQNGTYSIKPISEDKANLLNGCIGMRYNEFSCLKRNDIEGAKGYRNAMELAKSGSIQEGIQNKSNRIKELKTILK